MNEQNKNSGLSRRTMVKGAAWSVPVIAVAAATPSAAASTVADVDIRLSFGSAVDFDLATSNQAVADAIIGAVSGPLNAIPVLGPAALATLQTALNGLVGGTAQLINASISYPSTLNAQNFGPGALTSGEEVQASLDYDNDLVNLTATPIAGGDILQTGSGATVSYIAPGDVPNGSQIFSQPLSYNPVSLTVDLASGTDSTSTVATNLLTSDAAADGNTASDTIGITATLLPALSNILGPVADLIDLPDITVDVLS